MVLDIIYRSAMGLQCVRGGEPGSGKVPVAGSS